MASDARTRVVARARVQITVEILVDDTWGDDCPVAQVHRQAKESALGILQRMRKPHQITAEQEAPRPVPFEIVGDMKVTTITLEEPRS